MYRSSSGPSPIVKQSVPFVATAAHGMPGGSFSSSTFHSFGSITQIRRRSREPIHNLSPFHASACGAAAGEGNRPRSMIVESFMLRDQHRFEFEVLQQTQNRVVMGRSPCQTQSGGPHENTICFAQNQLASAILRSRSSRGSYGSCQLKYHYISRRKCHVFTKFERPDWTLAKNHNQLYRPDR